MIYHPTKATPISDALPVLVAETLPNGVRVVTVPCADWDAVSRLPPAVAFEGREYGRTGWDSDRRVAFYRTDARLASPFVRRREWQVLNEDLDAMEAEIED